MRRSNPTAAIRFKILCIAELETVTLILKRDREVLTIRLDDTCRLKPGEWTFELDLDSKEFKQQMGDDWSGVTWRVILSKKSGVSLW